MLIEPKQTRSFESFARTSPLSWPQKFQGDQFDDDTVIIRERHPYNSIPSDFGLDEASSTSQWTTFGNGDGVTTDSSISASDRQDTMRTLSIQEVSHLRNQFFTNDSPQPKHPVMDGISGGIGQTPIEDHTESYRGQSKLSQSAASSNASLGKYHRRRNSERTRRVGSLRRKPSKNTLTFKRSHQGFEPVHLVRREEIGNRRTDDMKSVASEGWDRWTTPSAAPGTNSPWKTLRVRRLDYA